MREGERVRARVCMCYMCDMGACVSVSASVTDRVSIRLTLLTKFLQGSRAPFWLESTD